MTAKEIKNIAEQESIDELEAIEKYFKDVYKSTLFKTVSKTIELFRSITGINKSIIKSMIDHKYPQKQIEKINYVNVECLTYKQIADFAKDFYQIYSSYREKKIKQQNKINRYLIKNAQVFYRNIELPKHAIVFAKETFSGKEWTIPKNDESKTIYYSGYKFSTEEQLNEYIKIKTPWAITHIPLSLERITL